MELKNTEEIVQCKEMSNNEQNLSMDQEIYAENEEKHAEKRDNKEWLKSILKDIMLTPSAQAMINIFFTPHLALKLFALMFVIGSISLASYLVIQSFFAYFSYGVTTKSRTIYETPTLFPKVTFCNANRFTTKYAYNLTQIGFFHLSLLSTNEKKMLSHDLKDVLIECTFNGDQCNATDFSWSFDSFYGNCYTFNSGFDSNGSKVDLKKSTIAMPFYGLQLTLYVNLYEELWRFNNKTDYLGAVIRIGNSSHLTYYLDGGIFISPGTQTFISVDREFKSILPKPYSNCEIDSNSPKFIPNLDLYNLIAGSNYEYTQQLCFSQCVQKKVIDKYHCAYPDFLTLYNVSKCNVSLKEFILHSDSILDSTVYNDECKSLCPLECNQTLYKTSISFNQLNGNQYIENILSNPNLAADFINRTLDSVTARESFVRVNVFYESLSYTLTDETPQMDFVSLLGSIGGNLGLFLGVSIFSICEIIEAVIEVMVTFKRRNKAIKPLLD